MVSCIKENGRFLDSNHCTTRFSSFWKNLKHWVYVHIMYIYIYCKHNPYLPSGSRRPSYPRSLEVTQPQRGHHRNVSGVNDSDFCGVCSALVPGVRSQLLIISNRTHGKNGIFSYIDPEIIWVVSKILHPRNLTWIPKMMVCKKHLLSNVGSHFGYLCKISGAKTDHEGNSSEIPDYLRVGQKLILSHHHSTLPDNL